MVDHHNEISFKFSADSVIFCTINSQIISIFLHFCQKFGFFLSLQVFSVLSVVV